MEIQVLDDQYIQWGGHFDCVVTLLNYILLLSRSTVVFSSRDWAGSKWCPVLKVWEQLQDNYSITSK